MDECRGMDGNGVGKRPVKERLWGGTAKIQVHLRGYMEI